MSTIPSQSTSTASSSSSQTLGDAYLNVTSSYIPDELINNSLLRVPVKPLLRCRSVCKQWCSLIDSTKFLKEHLQRNIECHPDSGVIFRAHPQGNHFYLADVDSLSGSTAVEIADPLKTYFSGAEFVGSCDGLVCLWKNEKNVILWNPATRKCRGVPAPTNMDLPFRLMGASVVGFGFDHLNDDYKIVRTCDSQVHGIMVTVYSLKSNSWTRAETVTNSIRLITNEEIGLSAKFGMFANGSLYWLGTYENWGAYWLAKSRFIFAFDLGVERHRVLPFPAGVVKTKKNGMGLTVFNRCLCLIDHYAGSRTDMWLMKDNGVENSWSKFLSVEQPGILGSFRCVWPVAISKTPNDVLLVVDKYKLVWFNCERNKVQDVRIHGFPVQFDLLAYTESFVQPTYRFKSDGKQLLKQSEERKSEEKKGEKPQRKKNQMSKLSEEFKLKL